MKLAIGHSLRARLIGFLLIAIVLTTAAVAAIAYRTALKEADDIFDFQMQQMALSLRAGLPVGEPLSDPTADSDNFDFVVQVWSADGLRVFRSTARAELPQRAVLGFSNVQARGTTYRLFSVDTGVQVIQVAQDLAARRQMAGTLALRTIGPMLALIPALLLLVWWVVTSSLQPVRRVQRQIAARHADELDQLNEARLPDEIRPLVHELNLLFQRLAQAFDAQKNFVADAAHELRSPLAALKLQVQMLRRASDEAGRDVAITRLSNGIDRASRLVEQLLVLARQQSSPANGAKPEVVQLTDIAQAMVAELTGTALARGIDLGLDRVDPASISAHPEALRILLRNLLDNALKYTPTGGTVNLSILQHGAHAVLCVEDSGPGIAPADRTRVLDRFYRVVGAGGIGSGLGLAIVKTIADLHHAKLTLDQSETLGGLRVCVHFATV